MKTKNNDYNNPEVGFDMSRWSVEFPESFGGVVGVLGRLFKVTDYKIKRDSLSGHRQVRNYSNGPDSLQIYYSPRDITQPETRIVNKSKNNQLSLFKVITEKLLESNFTVDLSSNSTSLNVGFPEDVNNQSTNDITLDKDISNQLRKVMGENKKKTYLLKRLDTLLKDLGYKFKNDGPVESTKPKYGYVKIFRTNWLRIYIKHSPVNSGFKFATIQIDGFKREKNSYWVLFLILKILKAYKIPGEDFYEYPILPSEVELAFDFYGYKPKFLLEITSSINCRKQSVWWSNRPNTQNLYTTKDDKGVLAASTHYVGDGKNKDYQIRIYNKPKGDPKFTRMEFRLKRKGLRPYTIKQRQTMRDKGLKDPNIDNVADLFTKNWILDFLKKISFATPNKNAFERIDSSYHPLSNTSLKSFLLEVPKKHREHFSRDCLKKNNELKKVLVDAANGFHEWISNLYKTSSILVNPKYKIDDTFEVVYDADSNIPTKYPVVQDVDLKVLFRQLPANTTVESQELKDAIRFSIFDYQHNLLAYIIVGESPERFMEPGDIYYVEKFKDVFRESPNQINTKKV